MAFYDVIPSDIISELFNINDRVCLITGAGGFGEIAAKGFAHNGAHIALCSRTKEKADRISAKITADRGVCKSYQLDIQSFDDCRRVTEEVEREFGRIDILINTAAIAKVSDTLHPDNTVLEDIMKTNFSGSVFINSTVGNVMAKNGYGRIINISSIDGFSVNCKDGMYYACSKAALSQATKHLAVSLAKSGVTVNSIAPVWIWTSMMEQRPADYMTQAATSIPVGRVSYSEDYLGILYFLASAASNYVTGQTFFVDGGWSVNRIFSYKPDVL